MLSFGKLGFDRISQREKLTALRQAQGHFVEGFHLILRVIIVLVLLYIATLATLCAMVL